MTELKILAISGSLRDGSHNTALLHAARKVNPGGMAVDLYRGLSELPLYRQDLDTASPPEPVADLRRRVAEADGLLIATPEHNASLPAALKGFSVVPPHRRWLGQAVSNRSVALRGVVVSGSCGGSPWSSVAANRPIAGFRLRGRRGCRSPRPGRAGDGRAVELGRSPGHRRR
jgi:NAD(P)H-dependent FMN reductase